MNALWLMIGMLAVMVGAVLTVAVRGIRGGSRAEFDLRVYRDQLAEVERDRDRGLLDDTRAAAARTEIERRMLAAADAAGAVPVSSGPFSRGVAAGAAILVPVGALVLYASLGSPHLPDTPYAGRDVPRSTAAAGPAGAQSGPAADMDLDTAVERLARRLEQAPEDAQGWHLLARSYMTMGRFDAAAAAFDNAMIHGGRSTDLLSGYLEARVKADGEQVDDASMALAREVLDQDPADAAALFYAGQGHAQRGDMMAAAQAWTDMLAASPPDAPWRRTIGQQIAEAAAAAGVTADSIQPSARVRAVLAEAPSQPAPGPRAAAPGPTREDMDAALQMAPEDRMTMIRGMVDGLAARLEDEPDDLDGWVRLERAYRVLGETDKAEDAARQVARLREDRAAPAQPAPPLRGPTAEDMEAAGQMSSDDRAAMIRGMVDNLAARLEQDPADLQGWIMLERSYRVLGESAKADEAAKRIEELRAGTR